VDNISSQLSKMPELHTERLLLRKMSVSDCADMYEYAQRPEVTKYLLWSPHPDMQSTKSYLESVQKEYKKGAFHDWAIVYKENNKMIGTVGFTRVDLNNRTGEVGYVLNPAYWGKGIAREAVKEVIAYGFSMLNLERIEARYMEGNAASLAVMKACGMTYEGMFRKLLYVKGLFRNIGICSILREEFERDTNYDAYREKYKKTYRPRWYDRLR